LLAAFDVLLWRYTGQDDIVVGTNIANRNRVEVQPLIGFFVNNLVLRTDLSGDPTFLELLGRVRESALGAYAHQDLPFEVLAEAMQKDRGMSHAPLFNVMFILQNNPMPSISLKGLEVSFMHVGSEAAAFDLILYMAEAGDEIAGHLQYDSELFSQATVVQLKEHFLRLLDEIAADPEARLSSLSMVSAEETVRLMNSFTAPL
jgi:non-ribosomal peptide synthetase component F